MPEVHVRNRNGENRIVNLQLDSEIWKTKKLVDNC